jgi:hypothetical protein
MSLPATMISPAVGETRPAIERRIVVLPQPEGPSSVTKLPLPIVRSTSFTATNGP